MNASYTQHFPQRDKHPSLVPPDHRHRPPLHYQQAKDSTLSQHESADIGPTALESKLEEDDNLQLNFSFDDNQEEKAFLEGAMSKEPRHQTDANSNPPTPTLGQIQTCMELLQKVMPQMFTSQIVTIFYHKLFQKLASSRLNLAVKNEKSLYEAVVKKQHTFKSQNGLKRSNVSHRVKIEENSRISTIAQKYAQIPLQNSNQLPIKNYSKLRVQDLNYLKRKTVVEAFCGGEGYEGVSKELARLSLPIEIDKATYDSILVEMMMQTYEKAEKTVANAYQLKQGPVVCAEPRSIQKVMVGCRRSLTPQTCQVIFQILLKYSQRGAIHMQKEEAMRMLQGINAGLIKINEKLVQSFKTRQLNRSFAQQEKVKKTGRRMQRRRDDKNMMKFELHRHWDNEFEKILIDMYRAGHQIAQIRDKFCQTYPHDAKMFSIAALRSMFFKILRMSIRRLSQEVWKSGRTDLPELVKLQDQLVKNIINCSECLQIRKLLIEIYTAEICGPTLLTETINLINQYSDSGGGVKKSAAMLQRFDDI